MGKKGKKAQKPIKRATNKQKGVVYEQNTSIMISCRNKPVTQKKGFIMKDKKVIQIDSLRADYNEKQSAKIFHRPNNKAQEAAAQYLAIKQYNRKLDALVTFGYVSLFVLVGVFASLIMGAL